MERTPARPPPPPAPPTPPAPPPLEGGGKRWQRSCQRTGAARRVSGPTSHAYPATAHPVVIPPPHDPTRHHRPRRPAPPASWPPSKPASAACKVLVLDHAKTRGEKIRISGGGRCNFTNINAATKAGRDRFLSANPASPSRRCARYTPDHFIALVDSYSIPFHEKTLGQLFCDGSSQADRQPAAERARAKAGATLAARRP